MNSNRLTLGICAVISALFACGYPDMAAPDTSNDGPDEQGDIGQDAEPITVAAGVFNAVQASPINAPYSDEPGQPYLRECDTSNSTTVGLTKCRTHVQLVPATRSFNIATNNGTIQTILNSFCAQLATKVGWQCNTTLFSGATCPGGVQACVRNTVGVVNGGSRPVFDLRRYQQGACVTHGSTLNTTFRSVSYQVQQCSLYTFDVDKTVISNEAGAQSSALLADVIYSIGLQVVGVGMTPLNRDLSDSATFSVGSNPYHARSHFLSNGQICRVNQFQGQPTSSWSITDAAGCGND